MADSEAGPTAVENGPGTNALSDGGGSGAGRAASSPGTALNAFMRSSLRK
jgi:hypothetical protein